MPQIIVGICEDCACEREEAEKCCPIEADIGAGIGAGIGALSGWHVWIGLQCSMPGWYLYSHCRAA
jgi:hypothetical protein